MLALHHSIFYVRLLLRYKLLLWICLSPECLLQLAMNAMVVCGLVDWAVYSKYDEARVFWFIYCNSVVSRGKFEILGVADLYKVLRMRHFDGALVLFEQRKKINIEAEPLDFGPWLIDGEERMPAFDCISLI